MEPYEVDRPGIATTRFPAFLSAYRQQGDSMLLRNVDGAICLTSPDGRALVLNATGLRVWQRCEYPITAPQLADALAAEYDAPQAQVADQVETFLAKMREGGWLQTVAVPSAAVQQRERYLWLTKRALVNLIYPEHELQVEWLEAGGGQGDLSVGDRDRSLRDIRATHSGDLEALLSTKLDGSIRRRRPHRFSHTMIGLHRLNNIERCAETVFAENVPGDFCETGVCRGGATIFMRALQKAHAQDGRSVWVADSFQGLPPGTMPADRGVDFTEARQPWLSCGLEAVRDNFLTYDLLDNGVRFLAGWFRETLPTAPIDRLALLRLDGDLYESTMDALVALYHKVSPGGFVIVDDYRCLLTCKQAVDDFRTARGIIAPLVGIDWTTCYWRKDV